MIEHSYLYLDYLTFLGHKHLQKHHSECYCQHLYSHAQTYHSCHALGNTWASDGILPKAWAFSPGKDPHWQVLNNSCPQPVALAHYCINSLLYLRTVQDKYVLLYMELITQLCIYATAIRILAKGYLPISLPTPLQLKEILNEVRNMVRKTNPDYDLCAVPQITGCTVDS